MNKIIISETDYKMATYFKALSNPVRLAIIRTLIKKCQCPKGSNPCSCADKCEVKNCKCGCKCGELVNLFTMSQSTISQHIKELKTSGLIETSGRKGDYSIIHENFNNVLNFMMEITGFKEEIKRKEFGCCHKSDAE